MSMTYEDFLTKVIDDGIAEARKSYAKPEQAHKLEGSIAGFQACRGKSPSAIRALLEKANEEAWVEMDVAVDEGAKDDGPALERYWCLRCKALEIEWVANVVSAGLSTVNQPGIVPVTARGYMKAADILGVA